MSCFKPHCVEPLNRASFYCCFYRNFTQFQANVPKVRKTVTQTNFPYDPAQLFQYMRLLVQISSSGTRCWYEILKDIESEHRAIRQATGLTDMSGIKDMD